ncbi:class I SAM-dependent methyltransferase [Streptomyces sp. NBC_01477]|uniref:class I SAM-dependent methyltransferase n=1 Tax=Streptomyces sp. NBC_01477 TaxID=2976015 RepID=UPI002E301BE0|nr:class I SAM-dependent methyltransferase [Streptomyces sp. NBC_01477]
MDEPLHLREIRTSYDTVAADYARLARPGFEADVLGRSMLGAFAELVRAAGGGAVADAGCGPGHVTAYLRSLGLDAFGVELSPGMVAVARRAYPGVRFDTGTMTALDAADGELGGVVAWYSTVHTPPDELPAVFGEFVRALAPGAPVLLGFHTGDERRRKTEGYGGHPMALDVYRRPPGRVAEQAARAGLVVDATLLRELAGPGGPQACLLLHKA